AVTMLKGSEKGNVIPPEASAGIDCRMLAGDDPQEIVTWIRRVIDDDQVEVTIEGEPKAPNLSPPDTELYKALADALRRRAPGTVVAPEIMVGFTDNWVFRRCGMHGYGFGPFVLEAEDWKRIHGNDERISVENLQAGPRAYFKTLICRRGRTPVGLALYFFTYSSFLGKPVLWLEDLLVLPAERGRGAGRALLKALARIAVTRGCGRMEWSVLDWNAPAIRFYRRIGARLDKEWIITRLTGAPLRRLARSR